MNIMEMAFSLSPTSYGVILDPGNYKTIILTLPEEVVILHWHFSFDLLMIIGDSAQLGTITHRMPQHLLIQA